jgi:hypothetical protein
METFFRNTCRLSNDMEKYGTARQATDNNITRRIACWIPKATNTHSEYVIFLAFSLKQWLSECASYVTFIRPIFATYR